MRGGWWRPGRSREIFRQPRHAYTLGLLNSVPRAGVMRQPLASIPGQPPLLSDLPQGCAFAPRCRFVIDACRQARPPLVEVDAGASLGLHPP